MSEANEEREFDSGSSDCSTDKTITVSNITFSADQIKSAVLEIDGREIRIEEKKYADKQIGFHSR
jgi:hypothetical protein